MSVYVPGELKAKEKKKEQNSTSCTIHLEVEWPSSSAACRIAPVLRRVRELQREGIIIEERRAKKMKENWEKEGNSPLWEV
jgi:hypothetical protein